VEITCEDEDLERPWHKKKGLQNVGQESRDRLQEDVMGGAGRGGPGKTKEEETGKDKPYGTWGFPCHWSREDGSTLLLLTLGLLSLLSGFCIFRSHSSLTN